MQRSITIIALAIMMLTAGCSTVSLGGEETQVSASNDTTTQSNTASTVEGSSVASENADTTSSQDESSTSSETTPSTTGQAESSASEPTTETATPDLEMRRPEAETQSQTDEERTLNETTETTTETETVTRNDTATPAEDEKTEIETDASERTDPCESIELSDRDAFRQGAGAGGDVAFTEFTGTVTNTGDRPISVTLAADLTEFNDPRTTVEVSPGESVDVDAEIDEYINSTVPHNAFEITSCERASKSDEETSTETPTETEDESATETTDESESPAYCAAGVDVDAGSVEWSENGDDTIEIIAQNENDYPVRLALDVTSTERSNTRAPTGGSIFVPANGENTTELVAEFGTESAENRIYASYDICTIIDNE